MRPPGLIEQEHGHEAGVVVAKVMHKVEADVWRLVGHGTRERACPERAAPQGGADGHRGAGVLRQPQLRELRVHVSATTLRRTRLSWPLTFIARVSRSLGAIEELELTTAAASTTRLKKRLRTIENLLRELHESVAAR